MYGMAHSFIIITQMSIDSSVLHIMSYMSVSLRLTFFGFNYQNTISIYYIHKYEQLVYQYI